MVFARGLDDHLASLAKELDGVVRRSKADSKSFITFLVDDPTKLKGKVKDLAKKQSLTIPLTIPRPNEGIQNYNIPQDAWVAAVAFDKREAVDTLVFKKAEFNAAAVAKIVSLAKTQAKLST